AVPARAAVVSVIMVNFAYNPSPLTVNQGDTVVWTNDANALYHDAVSEGAWSSGLLAPGHSFGFKFDTPGVYDYYCTPHISVMTGRIVVQAAGTIPSSLSPRLYFPRLVGAASPTPTVVAGVPITPGASVHFTGAIYGSHLSGTVTESVWRYMLTDTNGAIYFPQGVYAAIEMNVTNPYPDAEEMLVSGSFALRNAVSGQTYPLIGDIYQESAAKNT